MILNGPQVVPTDSSGRLWRFADCEFDDLALQLRVKGSSVGLELKPLEVLQQLLLRAGEVVSKEELLDAVWPGLTVVDGSLATAVSKLRRALGDQNSSIVITVPRVGYRLAVPVQSRLIEPLSSPHPRDLAPGNAVPGREHWRLTTSFASLGHHDVWLAEHPKTHELRVFKFAWDWSRMRSLQREVTVARFLRETLGERSDFVRLLEWNFESAPYFIESEYAGVDLNCFWPEGIGAVPLEMRLRVFANVAKAVADAHDAGVLHKDLKPANILLTITDGIRVRVADFGSASLIEPARLKAQMASEKKAAWRARLPWIAFAVLALMVALVASSGFFRRNAPAAQHPAAVAVLPFQNASGDASLDYLRFALPDEITTTLSYTRPLSIRPLPGASRYWDSGTDLQKVGRELAANRIVTGRYLVL